MPTFLLDSHAQGVVTRDARHKLKRSLFASLAIHAAILMALIIAAAMPHRFHFEQSAVIELQGIPAGAARSGGPKTASLKPKARVTREAPKIISKGEKISIQSGKAKNLKLELKDKILQKFQQISAAEQPAQTAPAPAPANTQAQGVGGIQTDVAFPFAGYLADIQSRIANAWEEPSWLSAQSPAAKAVVVFRINKDGSVARALLAQPSGMAALDASALAAVQAASPLPGLPAEFRSDFLDVHLQFDLTR